MKEWINKIHCGDCLEIMKHIPDGAVDLVLTDPPYGIGESNEKNMSRGNWANPTDYGYYNWDKERMSLSQCKMLMAVSKNQIIFGGNYFIDYLYPTPCWIVWDKDNGKSDFADCELAWGSFDSTVRKFKWRWQGMLQERMGREKEKRYHPTQKPVTLMEYLIRTYTNTGETVLDFTMGSGTTGVACMKTGRNFIGIEIDEDYFKIAKKRIKQAAMQPLLFTE